MAETYEVTASAVALTAATAKTVIEIAAGSTVAARVTAFDVTFDGVNPSAVPVKVELVRYVTTGTGTTATVVRGNGEAQNKAPNATAKTNDTAEPATPTVVRTYLVPPTSGLSYLFPLGRELYVPPSSIFGIRLTAPAVVNATANLEFEE